MFSVVLALFLYCTAGISLAFVLKKQASVCLTALMFGSIVFLYLFYIFDVLFYGWYALAGALLVIIALGLRTLLLGYMGGQISFANQMISIITPSFLIFLLGCAMSYFLVKNEYVNLWDELRLWGAFPKILHYTHKLQLGNDVLSFVPMQSYPPYMPLFIYFLTGFSESFSEASIFWGYAIFCLSITMHVFDGLEWKDWAWVTIATFFCIMIPCFFYLNAGDGAFFYRSLYIDPVLGVVIGYLFYQALQVDIKDTLSNLLFLLTVIVVTLLKDSGIMFALTSAFILILRKNKERKNRLILLSLAVCILSFISWKANMHIHQIAESIPLQAKAGIDDVNNWINLWKAFWNQPMILVPRIAFIPIFIILVIIDVITDRKTKATEMKIGFPSRMLLYLSFVVFVVGYFALYPVSLASFQRYMGTLLTGYFVLILFRLLNIMLTENSFDELKGRLLIKSKKIAVILIVIPITLIFIFNYGLNRYRMFPMDTDFFKNQAESIMNNVSGDLYNTIRPANVFLTVDREYADAVRGHHRVYYELIGTNVRIKNYKLFDSKKVTQKSIQDLLMEGYDYFYFLSDTFPVNNPIKIGENNSFIIPNVLYAVETSENGYSLIQKDNH